MPRRLAVERVFLHAHIRRDRAAKPERVRLQIHIGTQRGPGGLAGAKSVRPHGQPCPEALSRVDQVFQDAQMERARQARPIGSTVDMYFPMHTGSAEGTLGSNLTSPAHTIGGLPVTNGGVSRAVGLGSPIRSLPVELRGCRPTNRDEGMQASGFRLRPTRPLGRSSGSVAPAGSARSRAAGRGRFAAHA